MGAQEGAGRSGPAARAGPTPLSRRPGDALFVAFFVLHILTTVLLDSQAVLPPAAFPEALKRVWAIHAEGTGDPLVALMPLWFKSFVWCELTVQFAYFITATYAFWKGCEWIRTPTLLYTAHTITTMVAILTELAGAEQLPFIPHRVRLLGIYLPFLIVPLLLLLRVLKTPLFSVVSKPNPTKKD